MVRELSLYRVCSMHASILLTGFHSSLDLRTALPRRYIAYYPAIWSQSSLDEKAHFLNGPSNKTASLPLNAGHPPVYEPLLTRESYDTASPARFQSPMRQIKLGSLALARSGDKGSNLNVGIFVRTAQQWEWLRTYFSRQQVWRLLGEDADDSYSIERVEFPNVFAVHFEVYGILGRGVSSSTRLDSFGKGFADYLRDRIVEVPVEILSG